LFPGNRQKRKTKRGRPLFGVLCKMMLGDFFIVRGHGLALAESLIVCGMIETLDFLNENKPATDRLLLEHIQKRYSRLDWMKLLKASVLFSI
jgi:hypothetical protein